MFRVPGKDVTAQLLITRTSLLANPVGEFEKGKSEVHPENCLKHHKPSVLHHHLLADVPEAEIDAGNLTTSQTQNVKLTKVHREVEDIHQEPLHELTVERNIYKEEDDISQNIQGYIKLLQIYPIAFICIWSHKLTCICNNFHRQAVCHIKISLDHWQILNKRKQKKRKKSFTIL